MQNYKPTETLQPPPYPRTCAQEVFGNGGKDVLVRCGAKLYDVKKTIPLEGKVEPRKGHGLCGYLSLDQSRRRVHVDLNK